MVHTLLPSIIEKDDVSHQTVEELADVLTQAIAKKNMRNVALTGPYGSGKSSIIQTLLEEYDE